MILGHLNHVGVATPSIERSIEAWRTVLGVTSAACDPSSSTL